MLIYGTILLSGGIYAFSPKEDQTNLYEASFTQDFITATVTPAREADPNLSLDTLQVRGNSITLGESTDDIVHKLGLPGHIIDTEYDFDYYIYNNDYTRLLFIAMKDNKIIGFYSDSIDFSFQGISYGDTIATVNQSLDENFDIAEVLTHKASTYSVKILMDALETQSVTGIYILSDEVIEDDYTDSVMKNIGLMSYDLTNSARARNGLPILSWSSSVALAARKHCINMATANFFDHNDPERRTPGQRILAEGIAYDKCGENIIAGYGSAILANHGWYNSKSHRRNILNPDYRYLGVGFAYDLGSIYKTYITQNFYR
jgi:uncharacterized protein YkwD